MGIDSVGGLVFGERSGLDLFPCLQFSFFRRLPFLFRTCFDGSLGGVARLKSFQVALFMSIMVFVEEEFLSAVGFPGGV